MSHTTRSTWQRAWIFAESNILLLLLTTPAANFQSGVVRRRSSNGYPTRAHSEANIFPFLSYTQVVWRGMQGTCTEDLKQPSCNVQRWSTVGHWTAIHFLTMKRLDWPKRYNARRHRTISWVVVMLSRLFCVRPVLCYHLVYILFFLWFETVCRFVAVLIKVIFLITLVLMMTLCIKVFCGWSISSCQGWEHYAFSVFFYNYMYYSDCDNDIEKVDRHSCNVRSCNLYTENSANFK